MCPVRSVTHVSGRSAEKSHTNRHFPDPPSPLPLPIFAAPQRRQPVLSIAAGAELGSPTVFWAFLTFLAVPSRSGGLYGRPIAYPCSQAPNFSLFAMARRLPARRPTLAPRAYRGGNGPLGARSREIERQPSAHDRPSAVPSGAPVR